MNTDSRIRHPCSPDVSPTSRLFDDWIDPIETGVRARVRDWIEAVSPPVLRPYRGRCKAVSSSEWNVTNFNFHHLPDATTPASSRHCASAIQMAQRASHARSWTPSCSKRASPPPRHRLLPAPPRRRPATASRRYCHRIIRTACHRLAAAHPRGTGANPCYIHRTRRRRRSQHPCSIHITLTVPRGHGKASRAVFCFLLSHPPRE